MIGFVVVMVGVLAVVLSVPVVPVVVDRVVGVHVVPGDDTGLGQASGTKQQIIPKTS